MDVAKEFLENVIKRFNEYRNLGDKTLEQLDEKELHLIPNESCNSIAVIIQHLHGNMLSRWTDFLTEDGEKSSRDRDAEFKEQHLSKEKIYTLWNEGWTVLLSTLSSLQPGDLLKTITIRSQPLTVIDAIIRQLMHYSAHVGQIIYLGKWIKGEAWQTLSIPKESSALFNLQMQQSGR
jgi:hypothetical protein